MRALESRRTGPGLGLSIGATSLDARRQVMDTSGCHGQGAVFTLRSPSCKAVEDGPRHSALSREEGGLEDPSA